MQDIKEESNKDTEILKKNQIETLEMKTSIGQIKKTQVEVSAVYWVKLKTKYQAQRQGRCIRICR
jgi:flagellar biosynthesis GTPase FlhF